ncbi:MAG: YceI family protein, partial [Chitinophagaceae bacterium]
PVYSQLATFKLDVKQSKLFWKGTKTIGSKHYGYLSFNSGWLRMNAAGKATDGVFNINMKSIKSTEHKDEAKNKGIEKELNGAAFFETATYPTASITLTHILPTPVAAQFRIEGDLTIKKTTSRITFLATLKQNGNTLSANANLTIDRAKWGIHQEKAESISDQFLAGIKDKMVADEIPIILRLVFTKKISF